MITRKRQRPHFEHAILVSWVKYRTLTLEASNRPLLETRWYAGRLTSLVICWFFSHFCCCLG